MLQCQSRGFSPGVIVRIFLTCHIFAECATKAILMAYPLPDKISTTMVLVSSHYFWYGTGLVSLHQSFRCSRLEISRLFQITGDASKRILSSIIESRPSKILPIFCVIPHVTDSWYRKPIMMKQRCCIVLWRRLSWELRVGGCLVSLCSNTSLEVVSWTHQVLFLVKIAHQRS